MFYKALFRINIRIRFLFLVLSEFMNTKLAIIFCADKAHQSL